MRIIKLDGIKKSFGKNETKQEVLEDINLEVKKGESISIVGTSGSGKSTLLNIIGCVDFADSGTYLLLNEVIPKKINSLAEIRNRKISFVMQDFSLIEEFTVYDNCVLPLNFRKEKRDKKELVRKYLEAVDMDNFINKKVCDLSGGQKQRIAIARALTQETDIIIADEPTGALDSKNTVNIINILKSLQKNFNKTIIVVTHDSSVAKEFDKTYLLEDGKLRLV